MPGMMWNWSLTSLSTAVVMMRTLGKAYATEWTPISAMSSDSRKILSSATSWSFTGNKRRQRDDDQGSNHHVENNQSETSPRTSSTLTAMSAAAPVDTVLSIRMT